MIMPVSSRKTTRSGDNGNNTSRRTNTRKVPPASTTWDRKAAAFWCDVFADVLPTLMNESLTRGQCLARVNLAGEMADKALDVYETRWPGVYL
jgi:hypothetical protein